MVEDLRVLVTANGLLTDLLVSLPWKNAIRKNHIKFLFRSFSSEQMFTEADGGLRFGTGNLVDGVTFAVGELMVLTKSKTKPKNEINY